MSDLADLFPGFESHWIDTQAGRVFARSGGAGPPLVLLHGFPQTHVMWHRVAPALAERFSVVAMDLRGYGWSSAPRGDDEHLLYSKRAMAEDVIAVMEALGHVRFAAVGHDRGGRVAYRLALDHPGRLDRLCVIDIMPTLSMWEGMTAARALQVYHWTFLAQPAPLPERLIGGDPIFWMEQKLAAWSGTGTLERFDPRALAHYRAAFNNPDRIHAMCEDYRAGATVDLKFDREDRDAGRTIACPTQAIWGASGIPAANSSPLDTWRATFAPGIVGGAVESGHFVPEENPRAMLDLLLPFLLA
ncbi:alpha/beta hydrolase [Alsobacter sp. SYSU M60028]|uniref:Alpha/beta hydrolase n=1 Tax=Alsobacter ponti TaxID=2962936 RepID=A0ABT1LCK0_9HYPH|nr:alpha/beta hydrolase [Alsobacter ponti]MCP8939224.1 alpha/beta hydrolase [Alsobacter ponti]